MNQLKAMQKKRRRKRRVHILSGMLMFLTLTYIAITSLIFVSGHLTGCSLNPKQQKVNHLLKDKEAYPKELLDMLSRNPEMLEFVENYPKKKGVVFADHLDPVTKGEFPRLLQWDERWGYGTYGNNCLAVNGCAPTCLSMAIAGLTGKDDITPYTIAKYAEEQGYYVPGTGTSWSLINEGISCFGLKSRELPLDRSAVFQSLNASNPIICSMRPGDFTTTGHFILLVGTEDEKIKVHDPNSIKRSETLWEYETLAHQIQNLWSLYR